MVFIMIKAARRSFKCGAFALASIAWLLMVSCASVGEPQATVRKEMVLAVTANGELIKFNAGQPRRVLQRTPVTGAIADDRLVGIDFRVSRGVLFALSQTGRLYTLDTTSGTLKLISTMPIVPTLKGGAFGFDFNPTVDRIRVVSDAGHNLRLHPDTGAVIDGDPSKDGVQSDGTLHYLPSDISAGRIPRVVGAAYTYNQQDEKITTNYAIDAAQGTLVIQGSKEGVVPVISPNSGQLRTVGALGLGVIRDAAFDISDLSNTALVAVRTEDEPRTRLQLVDLTTGRTTLLGTVGDGSPLLGMAIEP